MGIRIFKQALALIVSLSVATPSWAGDYGIYTPNVTKCEEKRSDYEKICIAEEAKVASAIAVTPMTGSNIKDKAAQEQAKTSAMMAANQSALTICLKEANDVDLICKEALPEAINEKDKADRLSAGAAREAELKKKDAFYGKYLAERSKDHNTMGAGKKGMGDIWKYVAAAGVGAGAMMLLKGGKKKDKESEEEKKAAADKKANGVIKDSAGNEITCFSPEQVTNPTCKATLLSMCQGEKGNTAGCRSFEAGYCAGEGNGSNYCLYAESKVYCAQSGDMIASSPACAWKSARPASCTKDPEAVTCLASGTPEALTLSCGNYPNDPLCKANSAGRVVVQGGGAAAPASGTVPGTDNPADPGKDKSSSPISYANGSTGSVSMSSVIGGANVPSNAPTLAVISSSDNMWSSSGSAVKKACAAGQLLNCL